MMLAISSYQTLPQLSGESLDLAWTLDERQYLAIDLEGLIAHALKAEQRDFRFIHDYLVKDPYGEGAMGAAIADFFGSQGWGCSVTCANGVNGFLHALARLGARGRVHVIGDVYPDLPHWVAQSGGVCSSRSGADLTDHIDEVRSAGAAIVLIERPGLFGESCNLTWLRALCDGVAGEGTLVIVDESYGNYVSSSASAVHVAPTVPNLIVLRGLSKGYSLGGLRFGYAVASAEAEPAIRAVVPPLATASFSLHLAHAVLACGDVTAPLRERVIAAREEAIASFAQAGVSDLLPSCPSVPFLLFGGDASDVQRRLAQHGIISKQQPFWSEATGEIHYVCRVSVPLDPKRLNVLRRLMES